jgi:hypothetical protein
MSKLSEVYRNVEKKDFYTAHNLIFNWPFRQVIIDILYWWSRCNNLTKSLGPR